MRKIVPILLAGLLLPCAALAQNAPATLGYHTVYGRIGATPGDTGPGQAIPWATLSANLNGAIAANLVNAGPSSGSAANPTFRALVGADLPNPSATTLGGIESLAATSHQWINAISTSGVPSSTQPNYTDLAGVLPNPSASTLGGIESYVAVSHQWINAISTSGVPASTQPAFTDISGTATGSQLPLPTTSTLGGLESITCASHQWIDVIPTTQVQPTCAQPAFTDISGSATLAQFPTQSNNTILGNNSGSTAVPSALTGGQVGAILCVPVRNTFTSGSSQTYTTPTCNGVTATWLEVDVQGGGGGGGGSGTGDTNGTTGNASSFGALTANGGGNGTNAGAGGAGGTCSGSLGAQQNSPGSAGVGFSNQTAVAVVGGMGGVSFYGGFGAGAEAATGGSAPTNSGGGGAGGGGTTTASVLNGPGGGAGCHIKTFITSSIAATYTYTVGGTAAGGSAGTSGNAGGAGAAGLIDVIAHWQ